MKSLMQIGGARFDSAPTPLPSPPEPGEPPKQSVGWATDRVN